MSPDTLFQIANPLALVGWLVLFTAPWLPRLADRVSGYVIPAILSVGYTAFVLVHWSGADGGFSSLANVALLFEDRFMLLAGWVHFLAFDLFIGAWQVRKAREASIPFVLIVPCLVLTFLFGPAGLLAFLGLRMVRSGMPATRPA